MYWKMYFEVPFLQESIKEVDMQSFAELQSENTQQEYRSKRKHFFSRFVSCHIWTLLLPVELVVTGASTIQSV